MKRRDYLTHAFLDAKVIELRHQSGERFTSGLFDNGELLRDTIRALAGDGNLYTTLNAPGAGVQVTNAMTAAALKDEDISTIVRLPFDFDPVRGKGTPSTEEELQLARRGRDKFVAMLTGLGWPLPAIATSGNGAHALYRCRMANTAEVAEMLQVLYRGLKVQYTTERVKFDSSVRNASRIWRLYGSMNRKGTASPERPHRIAFVVIPNRWEGVSPGQIEALANKYARQPSATSNRPRSNIGGIGAGDYKTLDVVAWFTAHGLYKRSLGAGKHSVYCPWQDEHSDKSKPESTDSVVWEAAAGGWPTFFCAHDHCDGRQLADVLQLWRDADAFCAVPYTRRAA